MLKYAFDKSGYPDTLHGVLEWDSSDCEKNEYKAGIRTFTGTASKVILPTEVQPIDIIVIKDLSEEKYTHMALVLKNNLG